MHAPRPSRLVRTHDSQATGASCKSEACTPCFSTHAEHTHTHTDTHTETHTHTGCKQRMQTAHRDAHLRLRLFGKQMQRPAFPHTNRQALVHRRRNSKTNLQCAHVDPIICTPSASHFGKPQLVMPRVICKLASKASISSSSTPEHSPSACFFCLPTRACCIFSREDAAVTPVPESLLLFFFLLHRTGAFFSGDRGGAAGS